MTGSTSDQRRWDWSDSWQYFKNQSIRSIKRAHNDKILWLVNQISKLLQLSINQYYWWHRLNDLHIVAGQEKPHVHLAPEYEYRYKYLMLASNNQFKTCSMALNTFKGFCWLSCGPATCMKLILFRSFLFDSKFMFRGQMHICFFLPSDDSFTGQKGQWWLTMIHLRHMG